MSTASRGRATRPQAVQRDPYRIAFREAYLDPSLSLEARGLLAVIAACGEIPPELREHPSIHNLTRELKEAGYARLEDGEWVYSERLPYRQGV